jgi:hypothetical protein
MQMFPHNAKLDDPNHIGIPAVPTYDQYLGNPVRSNWSSETYLVNAVRGGKYWRCSRKDHERPVHWTWAPCGKRMMHKAPQLSAKLFPVVRRGHLPPQGWCPPKGVPVPKTQFSTSAWQYLPWILSWLRKRWTFTTTSRMDWRWWLRSAHEWTADPISTCRVSFCGVAFAQGQQIKIQKGRPSPLAMSSSHYESLAEKWRTSKTQA